MAKMLTIEIGYSTTRAVLMDYKKKKPRVYKSAEFPTPAGTISDGYIVTDKIDDLRDSIKKGLKKNKLKAKKVIFTVYSGKIISREVVLPSVKEHQINAVIQSNITEYFPVELDDYKIAHIKITTFKDGENAGKHKVLVIATENKMIQGYEELAELLKLKIIDIDYAGNSVFQAVRNSAGADAVMVVKIEEESTLVTVAKQSTLVLQRNINYNLGAQDVADDDRAGIKESALTIVGTVQRVIDFYESSENGGKIDKVYIVGDGAKHDSIMKLMSERTAIDCYPLDIMRGAVVKRKARKNPLSSTATAIGAGLASIGLDNELEKARHGTNYAAASILMILLVAVLAATMVTQAMIPYDEALSEQRVLTKQQQALEPAQAVYEQYNGMLNLITKVRYGQALTHNSNDAILDFLSELEQKLPTDVEVSDFSSDDTQCSMSMRVADKETAAGVINVLRGFESIASLSVTGITEETSDDEDNVVDDGEGDSIDNVTTNSVRFSITIEYNVQTLVEPTTTNTSDASTTE